MSGLEIGLMWSLIVVVIVAMVLFCIFIHAWGKRKKEFEWDIKVIEKTRDSLWDEKCERGKERAAGKKCVYTVLFKDSKGEDAIEEFDAVGVTFHCNLVTFHDIYGSKVYSIERENFISYKAELVDIDKKEE
jgi:hypothetical protein